MPRSAVVPYSIRKTLLALAALFCAAPLRALPAAYYARFSVLTPPGPADPLPAAFRLVPRFISARHKVQRAEDIRSIASAYGTDVRSLQGTNGNEFIFMSLGGYMRVHNGHGLLYEVTGNAETLGGLAARYAAKGRDLRAFREEIVADNGLPPSSLLGKYFFKKGERVFLPGVYLDLDTYKMPLRGFSRISSSYGLRYHPILKRKIFHAGCDIPMPVGTPVFPSRSGTVVYSGWRGGYGNVVEVRHKDGSMCRYGHLSKLSVAVGDAVQKSKTLLGRVGSTGLSTGPHLHFEIITPSGKSVNPLARLGRR